MPVGVVGKVLARVLAELVVGAQLAVLEPEVRRLRHGAKLPIRATQTSIESSHLDRVAPDRLDPVQPVPREPRGAMRRLLPIALAVAVPWLWFAVRAAGGPIDSVAVGLPLLGLVAVVGSAILAVVAGRAWPLAAGISLFAVCAVAVLAPRLPRAMAPPDPSIRLVLANVWDANPTPQAAPGSMIARDPDLLVAVEMPRDHDFYGSMTADAAGADLGFAVEDGELGVWSRYPIRELGDLGLPPRASCVSGSTRRARPSSCTRCTR